MRCAAIRCSRWRLIFRPSIGSCARSRQYRGWRNLAGRSRRAADGQGDGRSVLRVLRHGSQTDHAGHRRHVRCGPRWSAVATVQRPLRRIRGFQPIVVFDGEGRFVTAVLRLRQAAERPRRSSRFLKASLRAIRAHWPNTEILLRADSHYCPESRGSRLVCAPMTSITSSASRQPRHCDAMSKVSKPARRRDLGGRAAKTASFVVSWSSSTARKAGAGSKRIIARVEAGAEGPDTRFVVTNLSKRNARGLYEEVYCRRGQGRKPYQVPGRPILAADRTSCSRATANQFRLFLHAGACTTG